MSQFNIGTVYICERCSNALHVSVSVRPTTHMSNEVDFEAAARVDECGHCTNERWELIRDLYNALPWAKQQEFDGNQVLEDLERMIAGRQTVGYSGVTL